MTAVVAAFVSQFPEQPLEAAAHALSYFGCGWAALGAGGWRLPVHMPRFWAACTVQASYHGCPPRARRLAAELGSAGAKGPGSLRVGLLDNLWTMTEQQLLEGALVHQ